MGNKLHDPFVERNSGQSKFCTAAVLGLVWLVGVLSASYLPSWPSPRDSPSVAPEPDLKCHPPLPNLLAYSPPSASHPSLQYPSESLHKFLSARTSQPDIDSLSIAVVTPSGTVFEHGYGVLKANETDYAKRGSVDRDSIYRIASVSKMFATLETLILRERGVVSWDDPITKFFPNFTYPSYGWSDFRKNDGIQPKQATPPVTLRQLASHMSGLGRDYPPNDVGTEWPKPLAGNYSTITAEALFEAIAKYPLVTPQYSFPLYSNTGFALLGITNVAANQLANEFDDEPATYKELVHRDIFGPLALNSSFFRFPYGTKLAEHVAVPAKDSDWSELAFSDVQDSAGGQYSSLADLAKLMQTLLSPTAEGGVISDYVVREWLRPLYPWSDGFQEVGALWEIAKIPERETRIYAKGGNLPGYHSQFALVPDYGYGVIALMTGTYADTAAIVTEAITSFHPAYEAMLRWDAGEAYAGRWIDGMGSAAQIAVRDGSLEIFELIVRNEDILAQMQGGHSGPLHLWSTGRPGEFRIAIGRQELNSGKRAGCEPYWVTLDPFNMRGAPVDLIYFEDRELVYPAGDVRLRNTL